MTTIQEDLFAMQDLGYRDFHAKLIPNINKDTIIGVRTPHLRAYAKKRLQAQDYERVYGWMEDLQFCRI